MSESHTFCTGRVSVYGYRASLGPEIRKPARTTGLTDKKFTRHLEEACTTLVTQWWRICFWCRRCGFNTWVIGRIPVRGDGTPAPALLPGKFHGQRSLVGHNPWGYKESDATEWAQCVNLSKNVRLTGAPNWSTSKILIHVFIIINLIGHI